MLIKGAILFVILTIAFTQTVSITSCIQPNPANPGQCMQCLSGFTLLNGNCVYITSSTTQATPYTAVSPTASQLNQNLNLIASNAQLAAQLQAFIQQLVAGATTTAAVITTASNPQGLTVTTPTQIQQTSTQQTTTQTSLPTTTPTTSTSAAPVPPISTSQNTASSSTIFLPFFVQPSVPGLVKIWNPTDYIHPTYPDPNCQNYNIYNICSQCYIGFYVSPISLTCIATNPLCQSVTSNNLCISCYIGYILINGNCIINPNYNSNVDINCKTATNMICQQCYQSYYLNKSINFCQQANYKCKEITDINTCASCFQGYLLINEECVIIPPFLEPLSDYNCQNFTNGSCTQCVTRYYLGPSATCIMVDPFCQDYTNSGICLLCYVGYQLYNGACGPVSYNPTDSTSSDLIQCPYRSIPRPGYCMHVSDQCRTWSDITGLCQSCYQGYTVNSAGQCVIE